MKCLKALNRNTLQQNEKTINFPTIATARYSVVKLTKKETIIRGYMSFLSVKLYETALNYSELWRNNNKRGVSTITPLNLLHYQIY
jgi:hypothetical protein